MAIMNRRIVLASRPTGVPVPENFRFEEVPVPELQEGEVLIENRVFAIDPAVRGMLDDVKSYLPPVQIGGLIPTMVLGRVLASRNPDFREGDYGRSFVGWETHSVIKPGNEVTFENVNVADGVPLTAYMGAIGWSGITAYVGLKKYGEFRVGDEVLISAAAGAVGSVAGQVARLMGASKVVGTVNTVEFFLTLTVSATFIWHLGIVDVAGATLGFLIGGLAAAPFGAWAAKHIPAKSMLIMVGVVLTLTSAYGAYKAFA